LIKLAVFSVSVSKEDALKVAQTFLGAEKEFGRVKGWENEYKDLETSQINTLESSEKQKALGYVIDISPMGFIIVSSDTNIQPIIAYSFQNNFYWDDNPENALLHMVMSDLNNRLEVLSLLKEDTKSNNNLLWDFFLNKETGLQDKIVISGQWPNKNTGLLNTTWHQQSPYNNSCPMDPYSQPQQRCVVGCAAVALAQILNYWKSPQNITLASSDKYHSSVYHIEDDEFKDKGIIKIDDDSTNLDFPSFSILNQRLSNILYDGDEAEIADLCFACGILLKTNYSYQESLVLNPEQKVSFFKTRFNYISADVKYSDGDFYTCLQNNIKNAQPAILAIYSSEDISGHAIVCDGYKDTGEYHLNFGWGPDVPDPIEQTWYFLPTSMPYGYDIIGGGVLNILPKPTLSSIWYLTEGATYDAFDTFLLIANMNNFQINVKIDFLTEKGNNQTIYMPVNANSRATIKVDDYVANDGVSTVLSETSGKGFAVERAMYLTAPYSRWYGGHAAVGVTQPEPDWFLAEGATVTAGPAGSPFETYILVANPNANAVPIDVTFYPEGEQPISYIFNVDANRRLTISPQTLDTRLVNKSFSTKVHSTNGAGILVERAMWWRASNWTAPNYMGGTDSPGLPSLSSNWYLAEGDTGDGFDDFILIVNPNTTDANIVINYYLEGNSTPVVRNLTVAGNARKTINVRWDAEGIGYDTKHGTSITSTQPIAVERSMYWSSGGFGWKGGHNSIASPVTSTCWIMPEGATVPIAYGKLRTEILLTNPNSKDTFITARFLLTTGQVVVKNYTIPSYQRKTIVCNDITELFDKAFSTVVVSAAPIVVERSMYWDVDTPTFITRAGGTCSMAIPQGVGGGALPPEQPRKSITRVDDWEIY
jgi:hypothetical protein